MLTIKKRGRLALAIVAAAGLFLTGCGPLGPRALHKGDRLVQSGDYEDAISVLSQALNLLTNDPPARAQAYNLLGLAYHGSGKADKARQCYQEALTLKRDLAAADYNWGCLELEQTNYPKAADLLTTYTVLDKVKVDGFLKLGAAHYRLAMQTPAASERTRQLENARKDFEGAQNLVKTTEAGNSLGVIELLLSPRPSPAVISNALLRFKVALTRDPQYSAALLNTAIVYDKYLNDGHQALKTYGQYLAITPPPPHAKDVALVMTNLDRALRFQVAPGRGDTPGLTPPPETTPGGMTITRSSRPPPTPAIVDTNASRPATEPAPALSRSNAVPAPATAPPAATPPATRPTVTAPPLPAPDATPPPAAAPPAAARVVGPPPETAPEPVEGGGSPAGGTAAAAGNDVSAPSPPAARRSILDKINPLSWFGGRAGPAPDGDASVGAAAASPVVTPLPAPQPQPRPAPHYIPPPVAMYDGNHEEAERLRALGAAAEKESRLKDALANYGEAIKADPRDYEACLALGLAAIKAEDYPASLEALHHAVTLSPDSADARYAYAWTLEKREFYQDAANELEKMLAQHPGEIRAHLLVGNLYARQLGQPDLAREHYKKVLESDPHNPQATAIRFWLQGNP